MPIKPENRALYPRDWPQISREAKERAEWKCQHPGCLARQYSIGIWWRRDGVWAWAEQYPPEPTWKEARKVAAEAFWEVQHVSGQPCIVIVLTVAHLNHDPTDCRPENLRAMCQRHHLAHDHDHHRANAQATRRAKAGTLELF
jgi:hypothetical protein